MDELPDWARRRRAELEARAPEKRKKGDGPFARVTLKEAAEAFAAMNCPKAMVWLWLVHKTKKSGNRTVNVTTQALKEYHVSRKSKYSALEQLEADGLITIEWRFKKNPIVTLITK